MVMHTIDKLKAISKAFNSSSTVEQLAVNLDLAGLSYDEAEKLYIENNQDIIRHMSAFWCSNRKFSFAKALSHFDNYDSCYHSINHFALPYRVASLEDKDAGTVIKIYAVDLNGRDIAQHAIVPSASLSKDIFMMHGIDALHETILTLMYEITKEMSGGN